MYVKDSKGNVIFHSDGSVAFDEQYDASEAMTEMLVKSLKYPDLTSKELREFYGVNDNMELPQKVFSYQEDYNYVLKAFNVVHGFAEPENEEKSDLEKAKN